jgi:hypothetical protein
MTETSRIAKLRPLGAFAAGGWQEQWSAADLPRSPVLPDELRRQLADYLTKCPVFLAWMEHTRDELGDRFGVDGGAAIVSDGTYYWRMDAAAYIEEYGIPVPEDAIRHFASRGWLPPTFDRAVYLEIYRDLDSLLGGGEPVG